MKVNRNLFIMGIVAMIGTLIGNSYRFIFNIFIAKIFEPEILGMYSVLLSYVFLLGSITTTSILMSALKFVAENKNQPKMLKKAFTETFTLTLIAAFPSSVFLIIIYVVFRLNFTIEYIVLAAILIFLFITYSFFRNIYFSIGKMKEYLFLEICAGIFFYMYILIFIYFDLDVIYAILSFYIPYIIFSLSSIFLFRNLIIKISKFDINILKYSGILLIGSFASVIRTYSAPILLSAYVSNVMIGYYAAGMTLGLPISFIQRGISKIILPEFSYLQKNKKYDLLEKTYNKINLVLGLIITIISTLMIIFSKNIIMIIFGDKYIYSHNILNIFIIIYSIQILFFPTTTIFSSRNDTVKIPVILNIIGTVVIFLLWIVLIPIYGILGAVIAQLAGSFIIFMPQLFFIKNVFNIKCKYSVYFICIIIATFLAYIHF